MLQKFFQEVDNLFPAVYFGYMHKVTVHRDTKVMITFRPVSGYQCLRFVRLGLRSILVLFEKAKTGEDEVLVNAYRNSSLKKSQQRALCTGMIFHLPGQDIGDSHTQRIDSQAGTVHMILG